MSSGGGSSGGTQTTKTEPWEGQQQYLLEGFGDAGALYNLQKESGAPSYYPSSTVAPMSQYSDTALQGIIQRGTNGSPLVRNAQNLTQNIANGGGAQNPTTGWWGAVASQGTGIDQQANALYSGTAGGGDLAANEDASWLRGYSDSPYGNTANANALLGGTARGDYLSPDSNPWLKSTYDTAAGAVGQGVDSRFASAGRYGSGAHQNVLQRGLGDLATSIYGGNYQQERSRQDAANANLAGIYNNETAAKVAARGAAAGYSENALGRQDAARSAILGGYSTDISNRLNAQQQASSNFNADQARQWQAISSLPGLAGADYSDLNAALGAGQTYENYGQQQIDADVDRYNFLQNADYNRLQDYLKLISGSYGSNATSTAKGPQRNTAAGIAGGAVSGASMGAAAGPYGAAIGAVAGGILGGIG